MTEPTHSDPTHSVLMQGATTQLIEVQGLLGKHGIAAEIVKPPGAKLNG